MFKQVTIRLLLLCCFLQSVHGQELVTDGLNSPADELNPIFGVDGRTLYFIRRYHEQNTGGFQDPGDIWVSNLTDSMTWTPPRQMETPYNNVYFNGVLGVTEEGFYLYEHYLPGGKAARTQGISFATIQSRKLPRTVDIKYFYNKSDDVSISISEDGSIMMLSLESFGTYGLEDIYVSHRLGKHQWSEPKNVGNIINTSRQDMTPHLAPDNKTLFFASNGHEGYGGRDIFVSTRLDDSWLNWTLPKNLGPEINSEGVELYFQYIPGSEKVIYTTTQNSDGYSDIAISDYPLEQIENLTGVEVVEAVTVVIKENEDATDEPEGSDQLRLLLKGYVKDAVTGEKLEASIYLSNPNWADSLTSSIDAGFNLELPQVDVYSVIIESEGYVNRQELLDVRTTSTREVLHDFVLQPIAVGTTVNLENVLFVRGSTEFLESSYAQLDLVIKMMMENPTIGIELAGHTDNQGNARLNKILSQQRVDAVIGYFESHGIQKKRMLGRGYGGEKPIASNEIEETRKLNRRVEFTIVRY